MRATEMVRALVEAREREGTAVDIAYTTAIPVSLSPRSGAGVMEECGEPELIISAPASVSPEAGAPKQADVDWREDDVELPWMPIEAGGGRGWEEDCEGDGEGPAYTTRDVLSRRTESPLEPDPFERVDRTQ